MKVAEANAYAKKKLLQIDAQHEAKFIMQGVLDVSLEELFLMSTKELTPDQTQKLAVLLAQRLSGKPLQYLLGKWEFMGLPFITTQNVLIPRQDTETLVYKAIELCEKYNYKKVLEICTGSGCVAVSVAKFLDVQVVATDISPFALSLAQQNATLNKVQERVFVRKSDMFKNINQQQTKEVFDIIIANPPYIPSAKIKELLPQVKDHEPILALDGGKDGLDFYWTIASEAEKHLQKNGSVIVEVGQEQAKPVAQLFEAAGYDKIQIFEDFNAVQRVVAATLVDTI